MLSHLAADSSLVAGKGFGSVFISQLAIMVREEGSLSWLKEQIQQQNWNTLHWQQTTAALWVWILYLKTVVS